MSHMHESKDIEEIHAFLDCSGESVLEVRSSPMGLDADSFQRLYPKPGRAWPDEGQETYRTSIAYLITPQHRNIDVNAGEM